MLYFPAMSNPEAAYDPTYFGSLARVEREHFWFRGRNAAIAGLARYATAGLAPGYRVLEVGCGTGNVLRTLRATCPGGHVYGLDLFWQGLEYASQEGDTALLQADAHNAPFDVRFDLIGLFDVLEHLPDERAVLRDLHGLLAPGAALMVTVPADPSLWSYFDEAAHHVRRYRPTDLRARLEENGLRVEYLSPYMLATYPPMRVGRWLATVASGYQPGKTQQTERALIENELRITPVINPLLAALLQLEARLVARRRVLPFGSSLIALARAA